MQEDVCCFKLTHEKSTSTHALVCFTPWFQMIPAVQLVCRRFYLSSCVSLLIKINGRFNDDGRFLQRYVRVYLSR